ncbi:tetratricopeptide repeat protein [Alteraurantiacibacter buctensis]|uniref:NB-ARC domain-containing protein n=1 Tax=Alteraurantiacibacter buctensis TaxID=1503981 RepID=A0A844YWD7_9SPHN|nr:tetratricopeptide repeat protein [Alteraurantiacibacter buctensis]MXO71442.1 hypothetical protein [Alteraurantiacibacter buctensis]
MASIQRIALFILFDALETDLSSYIRSIPDDSLVLTEDETTKSRLILSQNSAKTFDAESTFDLVHALDLGQKFSITLRHKEYFSESFINYIKNISGKLGRIIGVRNSVMHGRPLTVDEYVIGFAFASDLLNKPNFWPNLARTYAEYSKDPERLANRSISVLENPPDFGALNNLPIPDYEDTGFLRRPELESELKKKILGRYPVITVLGDGGNGKTALTLHTLWNLIDSDDHNFDLILWYSAKTATLTERGIKDISSSYTDSLRIIEDASSFGREGKDSFESLLLLLEENKVLLVIDNLETITGPYIERLVQDVPGDSKVLLTSRVPISGDLPISVPQFSESESLKYLRILSKSDSIKTLNDKTDAELTKYCRRLGFKPLLIKWLALAVKSGASPERIVSDPKDALRFCLENVLDRLQGQAIKVAQCLVSVSESIAASVVEEISGLSAVEVESGLLELSRFALVEFSDLPNSERTFRLRPSVRSYIVRISNPAKDEMEIYQRRFQKIQSRFEIRRANQDFNRYEIRNYVVRTKGEAVAEAKLRDLHRSLQRGLTEEVEKGIEELKISAPGYFEVYRFEGYAAYVWSDLPRSIEAYEAALEYGPKQPQLHFFLGGMLLRAGYAADAALQFAEALTLDPDAAPVLREAARAEMRECRFDIAKSYLTRADALSGPTFKETALIIDLWVQFYQRKIDFFVGNEALSLAEDECGNFVSYLESEGTRAFDDTIVDHVLKVLPCLKALISDRRIDAVNARRLQEWINNEIYHENPHSFEDGRFFGGLKLRGRQENFGFLEVRDGREFFIARQNVTPDVWGWLLQGGAVEFSVRNKPDGRTEAYDVEKFER